MPLFWKRISIVAGVAITLGLALGIPVPALADCRMEDFQMKNTDGKNQIIGLTVSSTGTSTWASAESSGTSGCVKPSGSLREEKIRFVAATGHRLARDMAAGRGQYADSLAALLGCPPALHARFSVLAREQYSRIFTDRGRNPVNLLARVESLVAGDPELGKGCRATS